MVDSIAKSLGAGSGIDVTALVSSLVEAQFANRTQMLDKRGETLTAQVSAVSELKNGMTGFNNALKALIAGGTLSSRLNSSAEGVLKVKATGTLTPDVSTAVTVSQIASAQVSTTNTPIAADTQFRRGTLTLQLGSDVLDASGNVTGFTASGSAINISIGTGDTTLAGIAAQINEAGAGVTASVIADGTGQRLSIRGENGAAKAFELTGANQGGTGTSLATLNVSRTATGTSSPTRARDAAVTIDGVRYTRTTNSITDLVPGVTLDLVSASTTPVQIGPKRDTAAMTTAVNDVVATYNELLAVLKKATDPVSGTLARDPAARDMLTRLRQLTTQNLTGATDGSPASLGALGVRTNRDGTLSVDAASLAKVASSAPAALEAIFADKGDGHGLSSALNAITVAVTSRATGLGASEQRYQRAQSTLADDRERATDQIEATRTRMTRQFAGMDARVAAYRSTQTFLDQQVSAWNAD